LLNILFFNNFFFDFHHQFNLVRDSVPALSSFSSLPITVADDFLLNILIWHYFL
jgi:hypothetical protein